MPSTARRKIIWAVDPFEKSSNALRSAAWTLRAMAHSRPTEVIPVYLWGTSAPQVIPDPKDWTYRGIRDLAESRLQAVLQRVEIPGIQKLVMRDKPVLGVRDGARELVAFAHRKGAELIVVASHGKGVLERWALGSFAETLELHSDLPVLSVHPNQRRAPDFKRILFATDFSAGSRDAYARVLELAAEHKSRVILFHKVEMPDFPSYEFAFAAYAAVEDAFQAQAKASRANVEAWAKAGRARGVAVETLIDSRRAGRAADAILKLSRKLGREGGVLVALAGQSRPFRALMLGSVARQVVRHCEQPVWVLRAPKASARRGRTAGKLLYLPGGAAAARA